MSRRIPKDSAAIIVSESEDGFIDLQVVHPEGAVDDDRKVAIVNLAEQLLEDALFGYDWKEEDS